MTFTWPDTLIEIAVVSLLALLLRGLLKRLIRRSIDRAATRAEERRADLSGRAARVIAEAGGLDPDRQAQRTRSIGTMLGSLVDALILVIAAFMILQALNVNVMPALASAGIGGIAIGFGAQSLVKDIISGIFLMMEDQLGVGDVVDIGEIRGTVLSLGLRATRLQDAQGEIWYIRNGEIITLGNRSQGWSSTVVTIPANLNEDPRQVMTVLTDIGAQLDADPEWSDKMLEPPAVLGLMSFEATHANYGVLLKCPANQQWALERELRARTIAAFQEAGIKGPLPPLPSVPPA
ncbi:MAG: mechanosensitive ion channel family protein [Brooklawnia sp.]|jgi:small-conductance mechanosensitive channel